MGKKKDLDFKKVKIKIGKSKPSNNVTKFNIKTTKIVIPGENKRKKEEDKCRDDTYISCNETHLLSNMKFIRSALLESIGKKIEVMSKQKLDLTQSVWRTVYKSKWNTPWDSVIENYYAKIGSMEMFCWTNFNNAVNHKKLSINEEAIKCINLYFKLFGNTNESISSSKKAISIIKRYMKSSDVKKNLLALELALSLAKYCPFSFWFAARWRSAVFILGVVNKCLTNVDKICGSLVDMDHFLTLASSIIASVIDGRRAGLTIVGEDGSQLHDIDNPPLDDLFYADSDNFLVERSIVTDSHDQWDQEDMDWHAQFDLDNFLAGFSKSVMEIGMKLLPVSSGCLQSLAKLANMVKILSRCCLRVESSELWREFIDKLIAPFPYSFEQPGENGDNSMELDCAVPVRDVSQLSKKERKLHQQKLELERKMLELCRNAKSVKNVKEIHQINEEINFHTVALMHQCLVSNKAGETEAIRDWIARLRQYVSSRDWSRNELTLRWLSLGRQVVRLAYGNFNPLAMPVSDLFLAFSCDMFLGAHCASKVKRVALAVYVDACVASLRIRHESITFPLVDEEFWSILVGLIAEESRADKDSRAGLQSPHPTYASAQTHHDVTLIKAAYMLLQEKYPGVAALFRSTDMDKKIVLKECFSQLPRNMAQSQFVQARDWQQFYSQDLLHKLPANYYWDYFTHDLVSRKDERYQHSLRPLCSSIDDFLFQ